MSGKILVNKSEEKETMEDNARKFVLGTIDHNFLTENNASSFVLVVDWLETGDDNERKVTYKKFENGDVQILLISKVATNGNRISEKKKITTEDYKLLLNSSMLHLEKKRYEFKIIQNGVNFSLKYDEFTDGKLCILEIDADTENERNKFNSDNFPYKLSEITGDIRYYGYRIASIL